MSTRSATIVMDRRYTSPKDYEVKELFRFYRHCDGYPKGHGYQMARAFESVYDKVEHNDLNNRNWVQHAFSEFFACDCDIEVEPYGVEHGDLEYLYVVTGSCDDFGGKHGVASMGVTIAVYGCGWDEGYEDVMSGDPIFEGTPAEYIRWIEER